MLGNVFSPYYARARAQGGAVTGAADPLAFCTLHAAVYGPRGAGAWALTEHGRGAVHRAAEHLVIGRSAVRWDGDALVVSLDEATAPFPGRVRGTVRLYPSGLPGTRHALDLGERHHWWPVAPIARVEVDLPKPSVRWQGRGYHDANLGDEALEDAFTGWDWSRAALPDGAVVHYDITPRAGDGRVLSLGFDRGGGITALDSPARQGLPATRWGIARSTRCVPGDHLTVARTLEDTPFYARSVLTGRVAGARAEVMHEALDLRRFRAGWVRFLLPFRMRQA